MRRVARLCATAAVVVSGLALPSAAADDEPVELPQVFHTIVQDLIAAENRNDPVAMAALFTQDAILLPPGVAEPIQGRLKIRKFLDDYAKQKMDNHEITSAALMRGGPKTMIEAGTWSGDVPAQGGAQATHLTGTYLAVGILTEGRWRLWANAWQVAPATDALISSPSPQVGTSTPDK